MSYTEFPVVGERAGHTSRPSAATRRAAESIAAPLWLGAIALCALVLVNVCQWIRAEAQAAEAEREGRAALEQLEETMRHFAP